MSEIQNPPRDFKGIWIPKEIWINPNLTIDEKVMFAEIQSLDGENGCFASNEYFMKFFDWRERKVQEVISKLKKLGLICVESFDGRRRILRACTKNIYEKFSTSEVHKSAPQTSTNPHLSSPMSVIERENKGYNKDINLPPPKVPQENFEKPKDSLMRKMISLGYSKEEFNEAWNRYLNSPTKVSNVAGWLKPTLNSIRLENEAKREKVLAQEKQAILDEAKARIEASAAEFLEKKRQKIVFENKLAIEAYKKTHVEGRDYKCTSKSFTLLTGPKSGIFGYDDPILKECLNEEQT